MKRLKILLFTVLFLLPGLKVACAQQEVADSLMSQLKFMKTAQDSLGILYDVFDATAYHNKVNVGKKVLELARRTNNQMALKDFIPQVASAGAKDSLLMKEMIDYTYYVDDPEVAKTIKVFILLRRAAEEANYIPQDELRQVLLKYAREDMTTKNDFYEDMLDLYRMVIFLGNRHKGNIYLEYLTRLDEMMEKVPPECSYLLNQYYTTAANVHTRNGNAAKAIEMDRKLLDVISQLEDRYKKMGRHYRDYSRYYYISYRRMLSNYPALTPEEIKDLFQKCAQLAESNPEIARDFYGEGRPLIYRLFAEGDYEAVVPRLKKALTSVKDSSGRRAFLRMLVAAADSINDQATLLYALKENNRALREALDEQAGEAYQELQIRYDIQQLEKEKETLEVERNQAEVASKERVISVALAGVLVLAVVMMFLYRSNFKLRKQIRETKEENTSLHTTIDDLLRDSKIKGTLDVRQGKGSQNNK